NSITGLAPCNRHLSVCWQQWDSAEERHQRWANIRHLLIVLLAYRLKVFERPRNGVSALVECFFQQVIGEMSLERVRLGSQKLLCAPYRDKTVALIDSSPPSACADPPV